MSNLDNQLAKLVEKGIEAAEKSGEFIVDQAPDLLREFYLWHTIQHIMGIIISMIMLYLTRRFFTWCGKIEKVDNYHSKILGRFYETDEPSFVVPLIICFLSVVIFGGTLILDIFNLVQIIVAPKLYLIEYFIK